MRYYSTTKKVYFYVKKYIAHSCGGKPRDKLFICMMIILWLVGGQEAKICVNSESDS